LLVLKKKAWHDDFVATIREDITKRERRKDSAKRDQRKRAKK